MAAKTSAFEQEMVQLDAEIKRLEAEYNMFFAGQLPRLPWETRAKVEALVKHYDRMHIRNTAEKFRFGTLQARYAKFCDLWERTLKAKEAGRKASPRSTRRAAPSEKPSSGPRVVATASLKDPASEAERLKELYERLSSARKEAGEQPLPYDRFAQVVRAQVNKLGGGGAVDFRVSVQQGKVTLTANKKND